MIQRIRNSRISKIVASYLAIQMIVSVVQPSSLYALTSGPSQPEFNSFTPIGTSDMVNLSTGDFNYNIPIMDVGGYPLNLAYNSGITMDQEASWVGLGWNLNVGQINRQVRGIPDDFKGDEMNYKNDMKENITVGTNVGVGASIFGFPTGMGLNLSLGLGVQYNNYEGITFHPSTGVSFSLSDNVQVGMNISSSTTGGATVSPNVTFSARDDENFFKTTTLSASAGVSLNSRKGLENLTLSASISRTEKSFINNNILLGFDKDKIGTSGVSGFLSFNNNNLYTPFKRAGTVSGNFSFSTEFGVEVVGVELQGQLQGYGSYQKIRTAEKDKNVPAYGYNYNEFATKGNSILDFNREKDRAFNKNTTVLPIANHTYDIYTLQGQGLSGMFRPHRGQISYLMDNKITDFGDGASVGVEFGIGWNVHGGFDMEISPSYSYTGGWDNENFALNRFTESNNDINNLSYENIYYKLVGEMNVDSEPLLFEDNIQSNSAIKLQIGGSRYNRSLLPSFEVKNYNTDGTINYTNHAINSKIKRSKRDKRNNAVYTVTNKEALNDGLISNRTDSRVKSHHTAGIKTIKPDGSTYVYGETAYNWNKEEITVDVSGSNGVDCVTGTIENEGIVSGNNSDEYLNIITTPAYAHTYLLSSVLSSDYEDLTGNGPTKDDLGAYTLFKYGNINNNQHYISNYNWRTPYDVNLVNYNEGLKSLDNDQKGSIIKGSKELRYIRTIETKTHVAYFKLSNRKDGKSSEGGNYMKKITNIFLYSKPEYETLIESLGGESALDGAAVSVLSENAIKTAHFIYNYNLCKNLPNNDNNQAIDENELSNNDGKLTLKEVYFTYRNSNMGKFTPYIFNYEEGFNPNYSLKGYDIWGNYKDNSGTGCGVNDNLTTSEYPFVDQDKTIADLNSGAWMLKSIDLPSGGKLEIETEADDYQYVQDRKAMQMFKITGFSDTSNPLESSNQLYNGGAHKKYINIKISNDDLGISYSGDDFLNDYLKENAHKPIYFRALLNMVKNTTWQYDYVSGYFEIEPDSVGSDFSIESDPSGTYVSIPMKMIDREGGIFQGNENTNPIAKAGWYFGRTNLNRVVYSLGGNSSNTNFTSIVEDLVSSMEAVFEIFTGPNVKLQEKQCARNIKLNKSWIRLENPTNRKYGGGLRVKKIQLHDQWDQMDSANDSQFYGQEYNYNLENETSSGVATYEPNGSMENPLVEPFYDAGGNAKDKLVAPKESNYAEKPFGESFFPSPKVTYSRVTVKNIQRIDDNGIILKKHATGKVVNEFYTSKDFPTLTDYTDITPMFDPPGPLSNIFNLNVLNHLTFSQGFVIETNDMDGRVKSQRVFPEGQEASISGVDYIYNTTSEGNLSSTVITIDKEGNVINNEVGFTYDVYNDFRENYSELSTFGINFNVAGFVIFIIPIVVPLPIPDYAYHETKLRTSSTTKVIHRSAILKEKIAYDLGSKVSTKNIAWDANTGQILLTETVNEYNDHYFNFSYPAHWYYKGMNMATKNIGIKGVLEKEIDQHNISISGATLSDIFTLGDELETDLGRYWVASIENNNIVLMDREGVLVNDSCDQLTINFKIVRSGYRNQQMASMASVTSMTNPIDINNDGVLNTINDNTYLFINDFNPKIINASAVEYSDAWVMQWENNLPSFPDALETEFETINYGNSTDPVEPFEYGFNPYLYNVRGQWRAKQSYAYLTGRVSNANGESSPRFEGFFKQFNPFYRMNSNNWQIGSTNWTSASQVTQYSPFGAELENKDALNRYSSAQYGYNYSLPVAVASNSEYKEMGFDGFEDFKYQNSNQDEDRDSHFSFYNMDPTSNASLTNNISHSGTSSLAVTGETSLVINYDDPCFKTDRGEPDDCSDPVCDNGCTNYPECDDCSDPVCDNGCTNYPQCDDCTGTLNIEVLGMTQCSSVDNYIIRATGATNTTFTLNVESYIEAFCTLQSYIEINSTTYEYEGFDFTLNIEFIIPSNGVLDIQMKSFYQGNSSSDYWYLLSIDSALPSFVVYNFLCDDDPNVDQNCGN